MQLVTIFVIEITLDLIFFCEKVSEEWKISNCSQNNLNYLEISRQKNKNCAAPVKTSQTDYFWSNLTIVIWYQIIFGVIQGANNLSNIFSDGWCM